jgi:hypothetical protein
VKRDVIALIFLDKLHGCGEFNIVTVNYPHSLLHVIACMNIAVVNRNLDPCL